MANEQDNIILKACDYIQVLSSSIIVKKKKFNMMLSVSLIEF